ncbi:MAG: A/G-specific adenine glycosylase [Candidatus Izimaplasma sp.]|nr:A/G-specific adenine glycosylase [Candidatus Izimaplasma bacterium]
MNKQLFQSKLINWYQENKRDLPWRKEHSPYAIWVSEIMLQQTQVATVIDYYTRFIKELPTMQALAEVKLDHLLKLWEGLGYYIRARNMKKTAVIIISKYNGSFPNDYETLLGLPGIGPYTASAMMSIAFNKPYAAVDGNVYRVIARQEAITKSIKEPAVKKQIKHVVSNLISEENPSDFTEGLMELGATVCLPSKTPRCDICPINETCSAYKKNIQGTLPIKQPALKKKRQKKTVLVFLTNNTIAIKKRETALLNSLYGFYTLDTHLTKTTITSQFNHLEILDVKKLKYYTHVFTHLKWQIRAYLVKTTKPFPNYIYKSLNTIETNYSLPTTYKKIFPELNQYLERSSHGK